LMHAVDRSGCLRRARHGLPNFTSGSQFWVGEASDEKKL